MASPGNPLLELRYVPVRAAHEKEGSWQPTGQIERHGDRSLSYPRTLSKRKRVSAAIA